MTTDHSYTSDGPLARAGLLLGAATDGTKVVRIATTSFVTVSPVAD
jgi:hypothetical protein